jgi:hypothetical protein
MTVTITRWTLTTASICTAAGPFLPLLPVSVAVLLQHVGIGVSGNIAMTFVFWELVGICSYFLIGFYVERKSASTAANKAFIVNRVGDFGIIIGLMVMWSTMGTFSFRRTILPATGARARGVDRAGPHGERLCFAASPEDGAMAIATSRSDGSERILPADVQQADWRRLAEPGEGPYGYLAVDHRGDGHLLRLRGQECSVPAAHLVARRDGRPHAGFGAGALGHDGRRRRVSWWGRFYPVFAPEVLLVIASRWLLRCLWPPRLPSRPPTSNACWLIRPSASWAT